MALFVLLVVGIVVGQTWWDWRVANRARMIPDWAKGAAWAAAVAVCLASGSAFAAAVMQNPLIPHDSDWGSRMLWPQLTFLVCMLGLIVYAAKTKKTRVLLLVSTVFVLALCVGYTLS